MAQSGVNTPDTAPFKTPGGGVLDTESISPEGSSMSDESDAMTPQEIFNTPLIVEGPLGKFVSGSVLHVMMAEYARMISGQTAPDITRLKVQIKDRVERDFGELSGCLKDGEAAVARGRVLLQRILEGKREMLEDLMAVVREVQGAALACCMLTLMEKLDVSQDPLRSLKWWWTWTQAAPLESGVFKLEIRYMGGMKTLYVEGGQALVDDLGTALEESTLVGDLFARGVHVRRVEKVNRRGSKALQAVYAMLVIVADGVPRSLWEASETSLVNKGKSKTRESPLDSYVFREDIALQAKVATCSEPRSEERGDELVVGGPRKPMPTSTLGPESAVSSADLMGAVRAAVRAVLAEQRGGDRLGQDERERPPEIFSARKNEMAIAKFRDFLGMPATLIAQLNTTAEGVAPPELVAERVAREAVRQGAVLTDTNTSPVAPVSISTASSKRMCGGCVRCGNGDVGDTTVLREVAATWVMLDGSPFARCQWWCHRCAGASEDMWTNNPNSLQYKHGQWQSQETISGEGEHNSIKAAFRGGDLEHLVDLARRGNVSPETQRLFHQAQRVEETVVKLVEALVNDHLTELGEARELNTYPFREVAQVVTELTKILATPRPDSVALLIEYYRMSEAELTKRLVKAWLSPEHVKPRSSFWKEVAKWMEERNQQ